MNINMENIIIIFIVLIIVAIIVYTSSKSKVKLDENGLEIDSTKNSTVKVIDISRSEVDVTSHDNRDLLVEKVQKN